MFQQRAALQYVGKVMRMKKVDNYEGYTYRHQEELRDLESEMALASARRTKRPL